MITHEQASKALGLLNDCVSTHATTVAVGPRDNLEQYIAERAEEPQRREDMEIATAQAVEFAEYVLKHGTGPMIAKAKRFLSLPYAVELAARLKASP